MGETNNYSSQKTWERERERERGVGGEEGVKNEVDRMIVFIGMLLWLSLKNKRKREIDKFKYIFSKDT